MLQHRDFFWLVRFQSENENRHENSSRTSIQPSRSQCNGIAATHLELGTLDVDTERKEQEETYMVSGIVLTTWMMARRR